CEAEIIGSAVTAEVERCGAVIAARALLLAFGIQPTTSRIDAAIELPATADEAMDPKSQGSWRAIRKSCAQYESCERLSQKGRIGCVLPFRNFFANLGHDLRDGHGPPDQPAV